MALERSCADVGHFDIHSWRRPIDGGHVVRAGERPGLCVGDLATSGGPEWRLSNNTFLHLYEPSAGLVLETYSIPDPTDPTAPSFVNTTYSAETTELCYFVVTEGPAGVFGESSDTLCSIHLTADPSLTPGLVDLNFNSPRIGTSGPLSNEQLAVEFLIADGDWLQINSVVDNGGMMTAQYALQECEGDLSFRVTQPNPSGDCAQVSNVAGSQLSDELDPDPPVITAVQVDYALQEAVVTWTK